MQLLYRDDVMEATPKGAGVMRASFSSEKLVLRRDKRTGEKYWEKLSHAPGHADLDLLNRDGLLLENHDEKREIGEVVKGSACLEHDQKCRADIRVTDADWLARIDATGTSEVGVSTGYIQTEMIGETTGSDGIPTRTYKWRPYEISLLTPDVEPADDDVGLLRSKHFMTPLQSQLNFALSGARRTRGNRETVELTKLILRGGGHVPFNCAPETRDLQATIWPGAAVVPTDTVGIVPAAFNHSVVVRACAANVRSGLKANQRIPRIDQPITPQMAGEIANVQNLVGPTFTDIEYGPRRVTASFDVAKQFVIQAPTAEVDLWRMLYDAIWTKYDQQCLAGQGANGEINGLLNDDACNRIQWNGAATLANVLQNVNLVGVASVDPPDGIGGLAWFLDSLTRDRWMQIPKVAGQAIMLMDDEQRVCGTPALITQNLSGNHQSVLVNPAFLVPLIWGTGIDLTVDEVTQAHVGKLRITAHLFSNLAIVRPQAVTVSMDSAAS